MTYEIKTTSIAGVSPSEDKLSVNVNVTITYNIEGDSKLQASSTGTTINISFEKGERSTIFDEIDKKIQDWFDENFNPKS